MGWAGEAVIYWSSRLLIAHGWEGVNCVVLKMLRWDERQLANVFLKMEKPLRNGNTLENLQPGWWTCVPPPMRSRCEPESGEEEKKPGCWRSHDRSTECKELILSLADNKKEERK